MKLKVRLKNEIDPEEIQKYGFSWKTWTPDDGAECTNEHLHIFTKSKKVVCDRMTQSSFDTIIKLAIDGFLEFIPTRRFYEEEE